MIFVSGEPLDISVFANEFPENSVERKILRTIQESETSYNYNSPDQLRFELMLRKETANAARELNRSGLSFAVFHDSKCNPDYWKRTDNGGFLLKDGANPAEAINDIFKSDNKYATECATAMVIVFYKAVLNVFGEELFNKHFPRIYLMNWHSIDPLLREIGVPKRVDDKLPGDRAYFLNPDVHPETPYLQGENVIVLPDSLYYGHGMGITTAEIIIRALNDNRKEGSNVPAYLLDSVSRPNYKKLSDVYFRSAARSAQSDQSSRQDTTTRPARPAPLVWRPFPAPIFTD